MSFQWPWVLSGLIAVAGVAAWSLYRPARHVVEVASLSLWRKALDALDRSAGRRTRRVNASWVLLLAGAAAAVLAAAGPVWRSDRPARSVAVEILPSADLASPEAMRNLRQAVLAFLDRLDGKDRIYLSVPFSSQLSGPLSPGEVRERLAGLVPLPVPAARCVVPPAEGETSRTYRFAAAGAGGSGPDVCVIEIPPDLGEAAIDAVGAAPLAGGRTQLFLAVRNTLARPARVSVRLSGLEDRPGGRAEVEYPPVELDVEANGRAEQVLELPAAAAYAAEVSPGAGGAAFLARREVSRRAVAMVGPDDPMVRRFIEAAPALSLVADAQTADVVVANAVDPPPGRAALVIDPPSSPPSWRRGATREAVVLDRADVAADDPVMRQVDLAGVAVRRVAPWVAGDLPAQRRLATLEGDGLILRSESEAGGAGPRRVYVAFDLSGENTNFAMTEAFVVFLANAMRWLAPGAAGEAAYAYDPPEEADWRPTWRLRLGAGAPGEAAGPFPWPGVYEDSEGGLHAVSLTALRPARAEAPPVESASRASLPAPRDLAEPVALWPALAAVAVALWLTGWAARVQ